MIETGRTKKLIIIALVSMVTLAWIKYFVLPESRTATSLPNASVSGPANAEGTTMKEAIRIAFVPAKKWSVGAELVSITSADEAKNSNVGSGKNGRQKTWNVFFTDTRSTHEFNVQVFKGKVVDKGLIEFGDKRPIKDDDLNLDSVEAVAIAVREKGLKPGKDWAVGYHFGLDHQKFYTDSNEYVALAVFGLSPRGNFATVFIDESNGRIILAREKTYDEKGSAVWIPF